jgi:hypothetical protein
MRVKAVISFVSRIEGQSYRVEEGQEVDMPDGADWMTAGLVVPSKAKQERATKKPAETRAKRKPKAKPKAKEPKEEPKAVDKVMSTRSLKK